MRNGEPETRDKDPVCPTSFECFGTEPILQDRAAGAQSMWWGSDSHAGVHPLIADTTGLKRAFSLEIQVTTCRRGGLYHL